MKTSTFLIWFGAGLSAVIGLSIANSSKSPETPKTPADLKEYACYAAQMMVKTKLAPSAEAKFPSCIGARGVQDDGPGRYLAQGLFELPDATGLRRQHGYTVSVARSNDDFRATIIRLEY